jgi:hypothetical protein
MDPKHYVKLRDDLAKVRETAASLKTQLASLKNNALMCSTRLGIAVEDVEPKATALETEIVALESVLQKAHRGGL